MSSQREDHSVNKSEDQVYIRLQRHLDRQAVGFPATKSGAEIRVLKHIFTPREAEIATCLSYKLEPLEMVFERARNLVGSPDELAAVLDGIEKKGGIETKMRGGKKHYCNPPLIVGMYEFQLGRLTPEFISDVDEYTRDRKFAIEFLATELPQMRTIPIGKSIHPQNYVSTFDQVTALLQQAEGPFAIMECICRKKKGMEGEPCKVTERRETCLGMDHIAALALVSGTAREITREEAIAIIEQNQRDGLVLQPSNTEHADFICSCCGCCCGMLALHKMLPRPLEFWAANFNAVVDVKLCDGCGTCAKRCQVGAVSAVAKGQTAVVDLNRCIGCGLCVPTCPKKAISLLKKPVELMPPKTREDLYGIIMAKKKGKLGKLKLMGKMTIDSILAGRTAKSAN
jgi:H+/Na+-translocating ferredoxin:NAD+ oxidoreductase subunit B